MIREATSRGHSNFVVAGLQGSAPSPPALGSVSSRFVRFDHVDMAFPIVGMSDVMPYDSRTFRSLSAEEIKEYEAVFSRILLESVALFRPDVIHSHHLWLMTSLARQLCPRIPMVATCHGSDLRQLRNCPHLRDRVVRGCRRLEVVMALTASQQLEIVAQYGIQSDRIAIAGAGYDTSLFIPRLKPAPSPVQLIYVGKLSNAKGVPWLLRSLKDLKAQDWILHLVGEGTGTEKQHCRELASTLGHRVQFHGTVSPERVAELMQNAHVHVLPSFFEGLGLVVLEALAAGCRVVATDLPGIREALGDTRPDHVRLVPVPTLDWIDQPAAADGGRFEVDLREELQYQIDRATREPNVDLSQVASMLERFSWSGVFEKVEAVYRRAIGAYDR
jgi:glycosyltransferase involved in cell wall biosynthesis